MALDGVILDKRDEVEVEHLEIHLDVLVDLPLRHGRVAVEVAEGSVDDVEDLLPILIGAEDVASRQFLDLQVVALHDHLRNLHELLGHAFLGHEELILDVVVVLLVSRHLFHVLRVIIIVIEGGHRAELVESGGEHALGIHVGEAEGTDDLGHALAAAPVLDGPKQGATDVLIVDEVNPSEAHGRALPLLVVAAVDDAGDTAHEPPVLIGEKILGLAELEGSIFLLDIWRERLHLVAVQVGSIVGVAAIEVVVKLYEGLQRAPVADASYFNVGHNL